MFEIYYWAELVSDQRMDDYRRRSAVCAPVPGRTEMTMEASRRCEIPSREKAAISAPWLPVANAVRIRHLWSKSFPKASVFLKRGWWRNRRTLVRFPRSSGDRRGGLSRNKDFNRRVKCGSDKSRPVASLSGRLKLTYRQRWSEMRSVSRSAAIV